MSVEGALNVRKWMLWSSFLFVASAAVAQQTPMQQSLPVPKVDFRWDLLLRYDKIDDLPRAARGGFERTRAQIRPGVLYTPAPWLTFEGRLVGHYNSQKNEEQPLADGSSRVFHPHQHLLFPGREDNFRLNSVAIDRLNAQMRPSASTFLTVGKFDNPFDTTEAMWDRDLQPEGVAGSIDFGAADRLHSRITAGAFVGTQLYGDKSQILGGQYSLLSDSNWPVDLSISAGYYNYDNLDVLGRKNWRQNTTVVVDGVRQFASDFEIGDVLLRVGTDRIVGTPIRLHVDLIRNFGAESKADDDGLEAGLQVGPIPGPLPVRFVYTFQDLKRDAVMDGFNGDDWWLHSWYRGSLYRVVVPVWRDFAFQGTYVDLKHQEFDFHTRRLMVDLVKRF
jgi:hypothetical protein